MSDTLSKYQREIRPWGNFERFTENEPSTVKILTLEPNKRFSLQKHTKRSEFWRVIGGSGLITVEEQEFEVAIGDEVFINVGELHRAQGGDEGLKLLEIAFGEFDENDIERIEDDYGRV